MSFHNFAGRPDFDQGVHLHLSRRLIKETAAIHHLRSNEREMRRGRD